MTFTLFTPAPLNATKPERLTASATRRMQYCKFLTINRNKSPRLTLKYCRFACSPKVSKGILNRLTAMPYSKVFFFLILLISPGLQRFNAQTNPADTLKKVSEVKSLPDEGDDGGIDEKITYSADDSIVALVPLGRVILYGNAKVIYGSMTMEAAFLEIDYITNN